MADLDVMYKNGVPLPLSQDTLGAIFGNKAPFKSMVTPDRDPTRDSFMTPLINLDMNSSTIKTSSLIEKVGNSVTKTQKEELLNSVAKDPQVAAGYEINGNFDSWKDLATKSLKGKPLEKYLEISSLEGIDKSIFYWIQNFHHPHK